MSTKKYLSLIIVIISVLWFVILFIAPSELNNENSMVEQIFSGATMGTTYEVKISTNILFDKQSKEMIKIGIDSILLSINQSMSTYIDDSEISNFNILKKDSSFKISKYFYDVMFESINYYEITEGAFEPTIMPLRVIWEKAEQDGIEPDAEIIEKTKSYVGVDKIVLNKNSDSYSIKKKHDLVQLDFNAIAKGYAVDQISNYLEGLGYDQHYVEIGGEVVCKGKDWIIGISYPEHNSGEAYVKRIKLNNRAVATSGTYNQSFLIDGFEYSHIFNPRILKPSKNNVVSVTVISEKCIYSDALATSLKVIGKDEGIKLIDAIDQTECLFIIKEKEGELKTYTSSNFSNFFID